MDLVFLSRVQFALTIMFHYLFPPLTIGLGVVLVTLMGARLKTGQAIYDSAARFWTGMFALNFALGVSTGIVMEFQFGTNWARYSRFVGDVFGSALAAEGIFAFFLESGFLGVLVFGWNRVSPRTHFIAALMVCLGSIFSAVWIVVANSWQQTPAGFELVGSGDRTRAQITDFWGLVFNPSSMQRLAHTLIGAFILGAFFVLSISAYYLLRGRHTEFARRSFAHGLIFALIASIAAPISGHFHAREVARYQPTKLAAMEGHFVSGPAPLHLFAIPDEQAAKVRYGIAIPGGLSFLTHESFSAPVPGLDAFPRDQWPPVAMTFTAFHLMVALGTFFILISALGVFFLYRGTLWRQRWLLWIFVVAVLGPYAANQLGWVTAEVGRQPWAVYGLLRTDQATSLSVHPDSVLASIIGFGIVYLALFAIFVYVLNDKIQKGPIPTHDPEHPARGGIVKSAAERADEAGPSLILKPKA